MLEGPDLAGKTTTAKQLQRMMRGSRIVHRGPPESQDPFVEYLRPLEDAYYNDEWLILDRWHWGERIYGPLWRGGTIIDDVQLQYLEMACMRYGVSKLLFIPPLPALLRRFDARGDDLVQRDQMIHVADAYQHIAVSKQHNVHKLFEREEPFSRTDLAWIVSEAMGYRSRANLFCWWPSYVGPTRPEVLFIGERPAESHLGEFKTAFVPYEADYVFYRKPTAATAVPKRN